MGKFTSIDSLIETLAEGLSVASINAVRLLSHISFTITKTRIEKKMKQKEFADFMGVSQGMISKWESGDYNFTIKQLCQICDKLEITPYLEFKSINNATNYVPKKIELIGINSSRLHNGQAGFQDYNKLRGVA